MVSIPDRLVQIRDEVRRILEPDREPNHAARDAGRRELIVREPEL